MHPCSVPRRRSSTGNESTGDEARPLNALAPIVRGVGAGRTSDRIFAALSAAICGLRLEPGQPLSETELALTLGVSRTPLREAIARLVDQGLVDVVPQVGTRVSLICERSVAEAQFIRESLEVAVYRDACALDHRDVARMRGLVQRQTTAADACDPEAFFAADEAMHEQIYLMGGHAGSWQAVRRIKPHLDRVRRLGLPAPGLFGALLADHTSITDSLERGDVMRGEKHLRAHCRRVLTDAPTVRTTYPYYFREPD